MPSDIKSTERSGNFLIVEFKPAGEDHGYSLGITRSITDEGLSFDSQNYDLGQGEVLEFILKHPKSDLSVSLHGIIEWKKVAWYHCMTGLRFSNLTDNDREKISQMIAHDGNTSAPAHERQSLDNVFSFRGPDGTSMAPEECTLTQASREDSTITFHQSMLTQTNEYNTVGIGSPGNSAGIETVPEIGRKEQFPDQTRRERPPVRNTAARHKRQSRSRTLVLAASVSVIMLVSLLVFLMVPSRKDGNITPPPSSSPDQISSPSNSGVRDGGQATGMTQKKMPGLSISSGEAVQEKSEASREQLAPVPVKLVETDRPAVSDTPNRLPSVGPAKHTEPEQTVATGHRSTLPGNLPEAGKDIPGDVKNMNTVQASKPPANDESRPEDLQPAAQEVPPAQVLARAQPHDAPGTDIAEKHVRVLEESFNNNNADRWEIFDTAVASARIEQGAYFIRNKRGSGAHMVLHPYDFPADSDLTHEVSLRLVKSAGSYSYGIVIGAENSRNNVTFQVNSAGRYSVRQFEDGVARELKKGVARGLVNLPNAINTLKVVKQGNSISFYINGIQADTVLLPFSGRKAGFIVEGDSEIAVEKTYSQIVES